MTSEKQRQKFHTDDTSLPRSGKCFSSDWLKQISHVARPIKSTTQIFVVTRHRNGISALVLRRHLKGETSDGVVKCRLFSQAGLKLLNSVGESNEMNQDHQKWSCSCLKQGSKINDFCFKQAQGLKSSVAHLYPNFP